MLHLSVLCIAPFCGLFFMQNLRQTHFMFHADSTNGVWRPKTGEEETEDTLLIPANALKWPHQSGKTNWCLLYSFGTTKETDHLCTLDEDYSLFLEVNILLESILVRCWKYSGINGEGYNLGFGVGKFFSTSLMLTKSSFI